MVAIWPAPAGAPPEETFVDPRHRVGLRAIVPTASAETEIAALAAHPVDAAEYEAHRIALGVPRGGLDFVYGDAFPHEANMDRLHGVDFGKGCYVGQEVVSRMQHRGTVRTRIVPVALEGPRPDAGLAITAGDKSIGTMGSSVSGRGLALVRLDRAAEAQAAGSAFTAGGVRIELQLPNETAPS